MTFFKDLIYHLVFCLPFSIYSVPWPRPARQLVRVDVIPTRSGFHWGVAGNATGCRHGFPSQDVCQERECIYCQSLVGVRLPGVIDILGC